MALTPDGRVMRFSLRWLLVAVAFIAVSVVVLLNANFYWARGMRSVLILSLSLAIVGGIFSQGKSRAFWSGFAICGWIQFVSMGFIHLQTYGRLITDTGINLLHAQVARSVEEEVAYFSGPSNARVEKFEKRVVTRPDVRSFTHVAQSVLTASIGVLGGCLAIWLYSRRASSG
jgi:hypothetical protein